MTTALATSDSLDIATASDAALLSKLRGLLLGAVDALRLAALIWSELKNRGVDLSDLRDGLGDYVAAISAGSVTAEAAAATVANRRAFRAIALVSPAQQNKIVEAGALEYHTSTGLERVPIGQLTPALVRRVTHPETHELLPVAPSVKARTPKPKRGERTEYVKVELSTLELKELREYCKQPGNEPTPSKAGRRALMAFGCISGVNGTK